MRLSRPSAAAVVVLTCSRSSPGDGCEGRRLNRANARGGQVSDQSADQTRQDLEELLKRYPPTLPRILRLDPTLLDNAAYLQPYPELGAFLGSHPEVTHNPGFFFAEYDSNYGDSRFRQTPKDREIDMWRDTIQGFTIGTVILAIASGVIWLIKSLIDYRRWSRLSKIQTDVHNKLLDRFTANEDLLAYIQTPAGRRFLESSPITVEPPARAIGAPLGRILWSAQAGAVLSVLGLGIEIVAWNTLEEVAPPLEALGAVVLALGVGFLVSAVIAYALTRRFNLLTDPAAGPESHG